jgi:hypothetical protein
VAVISTTACNASILRTSSIGSGRDRQKTVTVREQRA